MKRRLFLSTTGSLILLCLGLFPFSAEAKPVVPEKSFRIASFNIRCPADKGDNTWQARLPRCLSVIRNRRFDVMGLQEATPGQIADLEKGLGTNWVRIGTGRKANLKGEASCIFLKKDRFSVLEQKTFWLSETPDVPGSRSWESAFPRICTWAKLKDRTTGKEFFFFNTHLDHKSANARKNGMILIFKKMNELAKGSPVFFTGDLNTPPESEPSSIARQHLFDAMDLSVEKHTGPVMTFTGYRKEHRSRIDYIYVSRGISVQKHATCNDRFDGKFPSDHDAVMAEVFIND